MVFLIEKTFLSSIYYVLPDLATVDSIPSSSRPCQHNGHGDGDSLVSAHLKNHFTDLCLLVSIDHDSGIKVVSAFLRILGGAHVNSCQSLSKSCPRNDPGDDESTSCYMQCKNSLSPIKFFFFFFFFFISLIADGPHHYHPACGHKGSSHLSPVHALQFNIAMQVQHSYNS